MNKYRNKKTVLNGVIYDSRKEAMRARELQMLEAAGEIKDLRQQVAFVICPKVPKLKGSRERKYIADFVYEQDGVKIIEDVKSFITRKNPVYSLKKQLVQVQYPDYLFQEY